MLPRFRCDCCEKQALKNENVKFLLRSKPRDTGPRREVPLAV